MDPALYQISLLFAVNAIVLLLTAIFASGYREKANLVISRRRIFTVAFVVGLVFLVFVLITVFSDVLSMI